MSTHPLSNEAAYDHWAASYPPQAHNPLMRAEQSLVTSLLPKVNGLRALDLASGTGRYGLLLEERGAGLVVACDLSRQMLERSPLATRVRADMMRLPFASGSFDLIVSGLAVGHAPRLRDWLQEMARVLAPGGSLVYSDFHPDAAAAGMTRSFTDEAQRKHVLEHHRYELDDHLAAATLVGLEPEVWHEARVGRELRETFSGSDDFYRRWPGLALVLAVRMRKLSA